MPFVDPNTVHNPAAGAIAPAAWGDTVRDDLQYLANPPRCRVRPSAVQPISNNAWTALTFDLEDWDTDAMHSTATNTSRITATTAGVYHVAGIVQWAASTTGQRFAGLRKNGTTTAAPNEGRVGGFAPAGTTVPALEVVNDVVLAVGDWVELLAFQDSGASLNTGVESGAPVLSARWVSL